MISGKNIFKLFIKYAIKAIKYILSLTFIGIVAGITIYFMSQWFGWNS